MGLFKHVSFEKLGREISRAYSINKSITNSEIREMDNLKLLIKHIHGLFDHLTRTVISHKDMILTRTASKAELISLLNRIQVVKEDFQQTLKGAKIWPHMSYIGAFAQDCEEIIKDLETLKFDLKSGKFTDIEKVFNDLDSISEKSLKQFNRKVKEELNLDFKYTELRKKTLKA